MTDTTANSYASLVEKLKGENRLAALTAPAYSEVTGHYTVVDLEVDLEDAYREAVSRKAKTIEVFADILRVPETFTHSLGGNTRLLSVVARSIRVEGRRAVAQLKYDANNASQAVVRILADEIEGEFLVRVAGINESNTKVRAASRNEPLRFWSYSCDDKGLVERTGKLPLSMLDLGKPLYQLLTASFDLAAGAMRTGEQHELGGSLLKWLVRWAAYPSPYLARLFEDAEALGRLLPVTDEKSQVVRNIPARTPDEYLDLATSQMAVAEKYELDENFKDVKDTIKEVVAGLVKAWIDRDIADSSALSKEIDQIKLLVAESQNAVNKAAKALEDQKFNTTIQGIRFETTLAKDRILQIVKATFEIIQGVVELGTSIASLSVNPGLAAAFPGDMLSTVWSFQGSFGKKMLATITLVWGIPLGLISELMNMDPDERKKVIKDGKSVASGSLKVFNAAMTLLKMDDPLDRLGEIGDLVSQTAGVSDPLESKAIWESFEIESLNQLEVITRDQDATASVISAAYEYKTCVQKFAIYGRVFAEQQALLAVRTRELGTLLIRKAAAEQKQAALTALQNNLGDRDHAIQTLSRLRQGRLYELRQSFFTALNKYQSAYFYEHLDWPAKMPTPVVPKNAGEMKEALADITRAIEGVKPRNPGNFSKVKEIKKSDDPTFFEDLLARKEATFRIDLDEQDLFAGHNLVRINSVQVWLLGVSKTPITSELSSDTGFQDRGSGSQAFSFSGDPVFISFESNGDKIEYEASIEGVRPTPFTTWTLSVKGKGLDLEQVTQVNINLLGKSVKRA